MARSTRRRRRRRSGGRETFTSAREAARLFYDGNWQFFTYTDDTRDAIREWADGEDVNTGRGRSRKLKNSAVGRKMLEEPRGEPMILAALRWVFGQAEGRRWDNVPWHSIDNLGAALEVAYEQPTTEPGIPQLYWWPVRGVGKPIAERLTELDSDQLLELGREESAAKLSQALEDLRETYAETRDCLSPTLRGLVERRIDEWTIWEEDPDAIPGYACEPDTASMGYVCNYPLVEGELRELRGACRQSYDPDWFTEESEAEAPGFPPPADVEALGPRAEAPAEDELEAGPREDVPLPEEAPADLEGESPSDVAAGLRQLMDDGKAYGSSQEHVVEVRELEGVRYQLELRQCGKKNPITGAGWCRCSSGDPDEMHGPYWYAYWRDLRSGRRRSAYVGKVFRQLPSPA